MTDTFPIIDAVEPVATEVPTNPDNRSTQERIPVLKGPHYELLLKNGEIVILYPGCTFTGTDFSGSNFTSILLVGSTFINCNFNECTFDWTDFSESTMEYCSFNKCTIKVTNFVKASLIGSTFTEVTESDNRFDAADISFCTFSGKFTATIFSTCTAISTVFEKVKLSLSIFQQANFGAAIFSSCDLASVDFEKSHLTCTKMHDCHFDENDFQDAVLTKVDFERNHGFVPTIKFVGSILEQVTFCFCDLERSDFEAAKMFEVIFEQCMVRNSSFIGAEFTNVSFHGSSVNDSDFTCSKFLNVLCTLSRFRSIDGEFMNLKEVIFHRCLLHGAKLNSSGLGNTEFNGCFYDEFTEWPDDYIFPISAPIPDNAAFLTENSDPSQPEPYPNPLDECSVDPIDESLIEPLDELSTDTNKGNKNS